ncbi:MAG: FGGY-family carbohydrate kinase [Hydrogenophaga sp.]|nr:FGGY-family carbohydrate kinase [Hydrogenophaga sp.]
MTQYLLGLDAGNTMTKVVLFDLQGREVESVRRRNPILFPAPGHTERDPQAMWDDLCSAVRELLALGGVSPEQIAAVSVSGYGAGLYLVDAHGRAIRPGIMSTDSRVTDLLAVWDRTGLGHRNGLRIQQRLWTGQTAPLLAWLSACEPEAVAASHAILFCKDYLRAQLCGDISTDLTDAGIAGLLDVATGSYPHGFYQELGLSDWQAKLPTVGACTDIVGEVSSAAAQATGLRPGTPVVRGLVDVCAAALASGVRDPSQLSVIAGTFSISSTLHATPRLDTLPLLQTAYPVGGYFLASEGSATSASNFEWYCKSILGPEAATHAAGLGKSIYEVCGERVSQVMDRANDILFFPFLFGGPSGAPAGLLGLKAEHDGADVLRAIFEGIVFSHKLDTDALLSGADSAKVSSIRLAGGAVNSSVWCQMFADILGLPVEVTEGNEVGARGTAICAAVAMGLYANLGEAMKHMVRVTRVYEPHPKRQAAYARKFKAFQQLAQALPGLYGTHD